jgi:hypothetical protein
LVIAVGTVIVALGEVVSLTALLVSSLSVP